MLLKKFLFGGEDMLLNIFPYRGIDRGRHDFKNVLVQGEDMQGNKMDSNNLATLFAPNILHSMKPGDGTISPGNYKTWTNITKYHQTLPIVFGDNQTSLVTKY